MYIYIYICVCLCICICICINIYIYIYTYVYVYVYDCICMFATICASLSISLSYQIYINLCDRIHVSYTSYFIFTCHLFHQKHPGAGTEVWPLLSGIHFQRYPGQSHHRWKPQTPSTKLAISCWSWRPAIDDAPNPFPIIPVTENDVSSLQCIRKHDLIFSIVLKHCPSKVVPTQIKWTKKSQHPHLSMGQSVVAKDFFYGLVLRMTNQHTIKS